MFTFVVENDCQLVIGLSGIRLARLAGPVTPFRAVGIGVGTGMADMSAVRDARTWQLLSADSAFRILFALLLRHALYSAELASCREISADLYSQR